MTARSLHRAARRPAPGRMLRAVLATATTAVVIGAAGLLASPATAASAPVVRAVAGDRTVTVGWHTVPGATGYTVRWGGVDHTVTAARHVTIGHLTNGHRIAVRVTANGVPSASTTVSATPAAGFPLAIAEVTASTGPGNAIVVRATGGGRATRIGVIAGGNSTTRTYSFHTAWYPATQRTFTVRVPASLRSRLGRTTGNFVYVKVVQTNSRSATAPMGLASDVSAAYRVSSPPGTRALAGATTPPAGLGLSKVTVGEMNVQSISATAKFSLANRWAARAPRVAKTMLAAHPDVLLTAELTTSKLKACTNHPSRGEWCDTQHTDLAHRLAVGGGYRDAVPDAQQRMATALAAHPTAERNATFGAHVFYDPKKLTLVKAGTISPKLTLKVSPWGSDIVDRWLSWALLTERATGKRFVAVAVHFPAGHRTIDIDTREAEVQALAPYLDKLAAGLPIVLGGDFNADPINDPKPDMRILLEHGYFDTAATTHRARTRYATFDGHNGTDGADYGYPDTVHPYTYAATRIDFILVKNSPYTYGYDNVLHFSGDSRTALDPTYRGSDHLFQVATIGIRSPLPAS